MLALLPPSDSLSDCHYHYHCDPVSDYSDFDFDFDFDFVFLAGRQLSFLPIVCTDHRTGCILSQMPSERERER